MIGQHHARDLPGPQESLEGGRREGLGGANHLHGDAGISAAVFQGLHHVLNAFLRSKEEAGDDIPF